MIKYHLIIFLYLLNVISLFSHTIGIRLKDNSSTSKAFLNEDHYFGDGLSSWLEMDFGDMHYVNEMFLSTDQQDMMRGSGKKVKGVYGFSNQGYVRFFKRSDELLKHEFTFGRAYVEHGFSKFNKLLISRWSRPFDQVSWRIKYKGITGNIVGVQLDPIMNNNRYLSLHTIDFKLVKNLTISFGESSLYAGENRGIELQYFNPTLFWIPVRENQPETNQANGFLYFGTKYSIKRISTWFEFLLDDYQIDRSVPEPPTFGYTLGFELNNPVSIFNNFYFEYSRVANRTYQTHGEYGQENYVHRNYPIGHYLGNDFESMLMLIFFKNYNYFGLNHKPLLKLSIINEGANNLNTPWDSPWEDKSTLQDGVYYESFPTDPNKILIEGEFLIKLFLKKSSYFEFGLKYNSEKNNRTFLIGRYKISFDKNFIY